MLWKEYLEKSIYFSTPKVKSGSYKFYPTLSKTPETFYNSWHNDHNYFKYSKTIL